MAYKQKSLVCKTTGALILMFILICKFLSLVKYLVKPEMLACKTAFLVLHKHNWTLPCFTDFFHIVYNM